MSLNLIQWIVTDDGSARNAFKGMLRKRKMNLARLAEIVGSQTMNRYLKGETGQLRTATFFKAIEGMGFEVVIRERQEKASNTRLAILREKAAKPAAALPAEVPEGDERDENGLLRRDLTEQERAEVEAFMEKYANY